MVELVESSGSQGPVARVKFNFLVLLACSTISISDAISTQSQFICCGLLVHRNQHRFHLCILTFDLFSQSNRSSKGRNSRLSRPFVKTARREAAQQRSHSEGRRGREERGKGEREGRRKCLVRGRRRMEGRCMRRACQQGERGREAHRSVRSPFTAVAVPRCLCASTSAASTTNSNTLRWTYTRILCVDAAILHRSSR